MTNTVNRGYPYPQPVGDGADASYWLQRLAESVDADVTSLLELETFTALPGLAGWNVVGTFDCLTIGNRKQVNYFVEVRRATPALSYVASPAVASLGVIIPPEARGVGNGIYSPIMLSGSGASGILQGFVAPATGELFFRHTSNITISQNQSLYFSGIYYTAATP